MHIVAYCRSCELRTEYERLKAEYFEAECEQKKARQLLMTVRHDLKELKKLLVNSAKFNSYQAQLVRP